VTQGHCTCENCRAWDGPPGKDGKPILSDRDITFANKLAEGLEKKFPGKGFEVIVNGVWLYKACPPKKQNHSKM
jgi:hypothetical protein